MSNEGSDCGTPISNVDGNRKKKSDKDLNENGISPHVRDKSGKKKKKDRERDRDRERQRDLYNYMSGGTGNMSGNKRDVIMDTPMKRKRDDNDVSNSSILSGGGSTPDTNTAYNKRLHLDGNNSNRHRDRNHERKKHSDIVGVSGGGRMSNACGSSKGNYGTLGGDTRGPGSYTEFPDRWGHGRDRYSGSSGDFKRERYDSYNNRNNFHHHERDRSRDRRSEKGRYAVPHGAAPLNYPSQFMHSSYYMSKGGMPPAAMSHTSGSSAYRDPRGYPPGIMATRDTRFEYGAHNLDYRRAGSDYDRRSQT